jgi:NO-binding membrane sensor protein with MHYT domain
VITSIVLAVFFAPVILPNITNTAIIYHLLLHIASVIIAIFLGVVSILAYSRNRKRRLLFMTFGFLSLSMIEAIYLVHITSNIQDLVIPIVDVEFSHLVFLVMLTFFGIGIFSASKR